MYSSVRCSSTVLVGCCVAYDDTCDDIRTQTLIVLLVLGVRPRLLSHYMTMPISVLLGPLSGVHRAARRGLLPLTDLPDDDIMMPLPTAAGDSDRLQVIDSTSAKGAVQSLPCAENTVSRIRRLLAQAA